jgi:hypothetical protein
MSDMKVVADPGTHEIVITRSFDAPRELVDRDGMLQSGMESGAAESFDRLDEYLAKG